jgi:Spy/CpxP family protein refolding chaperone
MMIAAAGLLALSSVAMSPSANAAGCLRGAVAGGAIGHYAGHHGLVGAGIGCAYEHHEATKRGREQMHDDRY